MPINLADFPTAVADYLNTHVTTTVTEVVADSGSLNPDEEGTFTVTVTNADAPVGVRLIDVKYHLKVEPTGIASLKVPGSAILNSRATIDPNDPLLPRNTFVNEMFIFPASVLDQSVLEVGDTDTLTLEVKGVNEGSTTLTCHVHADIDQDSLFPHNKKSDDGDQGVRVR